MEVIAMATRKPARFPCWPGGEGLPARESAQYMSEVARRVEQLSASEWSQRRPISIVGNHPSLIDALTKAEKIAAFDEPVLITGESGSGKEALAEAIFLLGPRRGKPFVAVNCPQFQEGNLTVSELFGHRKGSFTGAIADRKGCFDVADGGVIFLDEVGDLHMSAQVMLLRALATGEFQSLGDSRTHSVNVRVVAASNRPLQKTGIGEQFRNDLFFRLRYFHIQVPPLRERGEDWQLLVAFYLARLQLQYGVTKRFSAESLKILAGYDWPGNVRELGSVVTMGYALSDGETIEPSNFMTLLEREERAVQATDEDLYRRVLVNGEGFWETVHEPFMGRDLNRSQVKELIRRGLMGARGSYRKLIRDFGLPAADYQKFMDFLRHQRLKP
jgi:transcriptional regulator with GAF, ATPase, and Fis domain